MVDSPGLVFELRAADQRGWGYFIDDAFMGPPRVMNAAQGSLHARPIGGSDWIELRSGQTDARAFKVKKREGRGLLGRWGRREKRAAVAKPADLGLFRLWSQTLSGEVDPPAATEAAARLSAGDDVVDKILGEAAIMAKNLALLGHTWDGSLLARLLAAASSASGVGAAPSVRASVACEFLETARLRLIDVPDPVLLRSARAAGDGALAWGHEQDDLLVVEQATFRLGALHLDPYTSNRNTGTYWLQNATWLRRGMAALGMAPADVSETDLREFMPSPVEALRIAEGYLRQSVEVRHGEYRGLALKALAQALVFLMGFGEPISAANLEHVALEALSLLPEHQEEARLYVWQFLSAETRIRLRAPPVPTGPATGQSNEAAALAAVAVAAAGRDAEAATGLVAQRRELLATQENPDWAGQLLLELRVAIENTLTLAGRQREAWPDSVVAQADLRAQVESGDEASAVRCAVLLDLAERATATGIGPDQGLLCVDAAVTINPGHLGVPEDTITYLRARLWFDVAGYQRKEREADLDPVALVSAYAHAADFFHWADVPDQAVEALSSLTAFVPRLEPKDCAKLVLDLMGTTLGLSDRADPETDRVVQAYHATTVGHMYAGGTTHDFVLRACQIAKGSRLASALALGRRSGLAVPPWLESELTRADADEASLIDTEADDALVEAEDWLVVSYADTVEKVPSDTALRQLRGRQRRLDQVLGRLVPRPGKSLVRSLQQVQQLLDERAMLLMTVPGVWRTGTWGSCCLLVTRDNAHLQYIDSEIPYGDVTVKTAGRTMRSSPDAVLVAALRRSLQEESEPDVATDDAFSLLDGGKRLGDLWLRLDELLRDGYDHLLIAPHGPGHYVPWHLLGTPDEPLATRCTVSMLPSLALLNPGSFTDLALSSLHARPPAIFGLSYRKVDSHGGGPLPDAEEEARAVAYIFGVKATLEEKATVGAVLEGLQTAKFVHIAAHGRHNVDAPAFQSIQLAGAPGRLPAHRLSTCDLRGLSLVTLSACETALGRFDRADDLRGIPAALFLAGVRSIIGTLWEVRSSTARIFFVALYRSLVAGATVATAYRAAQEETRQSFPSYRDWGAFVLLGGLPERYASKEIR